MKKLAALFAALGLALASPVALAGDDAGRPKPAQPRKEQLLDRIEVLRTAKITKALDLSPAEADRLFPLLRQQADRRKALIQEKWAHTRELELELKKPAPDPATVARYLERLQSDKRAAWEADASDYEALRKQLGPVQLARYYKASQAFERQIRRLVNEVKGGKPADGGGRKGKGQGKRPAGDEGAPAPSK